MSRGVSRYHNHSSQIKLSVKEAKKKSLKGSKVKKEKNRREGGGDKKRPVKKSLFGK